MTRRNRRDSWMTKRQLKQYKKDNGRTIRPRKLLYDGLGEMNPLTMLALAGAMVGLAYTAGCIGYSEDDVAVGDEVELEGTVVDENHWAGDDQTYNTKDDLYQIKMTSRNGEKAVDFHGDSWNCSGMDEKIDEGYELKVRAIKESRGHYNALEVKKIKKK